MKSYIVILVLGLAIFANTAAAKSEKVSVCHETGSSKNPLVLISVSKNALSSHLNHGDFILPEDMINCEEEAPQPF